MSSWDRPTAEEVAREAQLAQAMSLSRKRRKEERKESVSYMRQLSSGAVVFALFTVVGIRIVLGLAGVW